MKPPFGAIYYLPTRYGSPLKEPSAIDRLAALGDPEGESAERAHKWDEHERQLRELVEESVQRNLGDL
jgi:hypothetical protein